MQGPNKITISLLLILLITVAASVNTLLGQEQVTADADQQGRRAKEEDEKIKSRYPVAVYDAPDDSDWEKQRARRAKNSRYDRYGFVKKQPATDIAETVFYADWYGDKPALPVRESAAIISGVVVSAEAHLSNDKSGVYTELTVEVEELLKGDGSRLSSGSRIGVDRPGGYVRYPSGYERLYRYSGMNAPLVGKKYLFFLADPQPGQNYSLLTGYALTPEGVTPLDSLANFNSLPRLGTDALLEKVRELVRNPHP